MFQRFADATKSRTMSPFPPWNRGLLCTRGGQGSEDVSSSHPLSTLLPSTTHSAHHHVLLTCTPYGVWFEGHNVKPPACFAVRHICYD